MSNDIYDHVMLSLKKIISRVEEHSADWWWLEGGSVPLIAVRKLEIADGKVIFDYGPKRSVIEALRIIRKNLERLMEIPDEKRVEIAFGIARDLYLVLQAVAYIFEAHELAEKLVKYRKELAKVDPGLVDEYLNKVNPIIRRLREIMVSNVFSWPEKKEEVLREINRVISETESMLGKKIEIKETELESEGGVIA